MRESLCTETGCSYDKGVRVRNVLDYLRNDIGLGRIRSAVRQPLAGRRVVSYYGCLNTRVPTGASICTACFRGTISYIETASPTTPISVTSFDYLPQTVVGNLAGSAAYSGTTTLFEGIALRYLVTGYLAVTNTTQVSFSVLDVPTASTWGLAALGGALLLTGLLVLRRI